MAALWTGLRRHCRFKLSNVFLTLCCLVAGVLVVDYFIGWNRLFSYKSGDVTSRGDEGNSIRRRHKTIGMTKTNEQICKPPKLSLETDQNIGDFHRMPPLRCVGEALMYLKDGAIVVNETVLGTRSIKLCVYRGIDRSGDDAHQYTKAHIRTKAPFELRINHDFFHVVCYLNKAANLPGPQVEWSAVAKALEGRDFTNFDTDLDLAAIARSGVDITKFPDFEQYFAHTVPKEEVLQRVKDVDDKEKKMDVIILMIDSLSHLSYQRKLPKTYAFVKHTLKSVILDGYNIVGDSTAPNILALLTGKKAPELPEARRGQAGSTYVDGFSLLWYDFERQGYVTMFGEDEPASGMFNLGLNGFEQMPTDHYMRPFWQAVSHPSSRSFSPKYCLGDKPKHRYALDYLKHFCTTYRDVPKFSFVAHGELSSNGNNPVEYLDNDLVEFLAFLNNNQYLDNTLLVLMADHGARHSQVRHRLQGKIEELMPLMSFSFPSWFRQKHVDKIRNLERNVHALTTPYDVYETLQDVLDMERTTVPLRANQRGISLLRELPLNRTCSSAGVDVHFCTCVQYQSIDRNERQVQMAAETAMTYINELLHDVSDQCIKLTLGTIIDALQVLPAEMVLQNRLEKSKKKRSSLASSSDEYMKLDRVHYQVTFQTLPNQGVYEATVFVDKTAPSSHVASISRTNAYRDERKCISQTRPDLERFCQCRHVVRSVG